MNLPTAEWLSKTIAAAHENSKAHGFWEKPHDDLDEKIALIHSELSEALEEARVPDARLGMLFFEGLDTTTGQIVRFKQDYPECTVCGKVLEDCGCDGLQKVRHFKPVGFQSEMADVAIRVFDYVDFTRRADLWRVSEWPILTHPAKKSIAADIAFLHERVALIRSAAFGAEELLPNTWALAERVIAAGPTNVGSFQDVIEIKMAFNRSRPMKHGKNF